MIVVIDNYDSFVYNLVQVFQTLADQVVVFRNDRVTVDRIREMRPSHLVVSPGPCTPDKAGVSIDAIRELGPSIPTLGVCLGHEAIGEAFGGRMRRCEKVYHGKTSDIRHDGRTIFKGIDAPMTVGRYHSLVIDPDTLPAELEVSASADDGTIMAVRHKTYPIEGVQFHPESVLTPQGRWLCENFLFGGRERTTLKTAIRTVVDGADLSEERAADAMKLILSGAATPAQIATIITGLRCKGEAASEIAGFARVMRSFARKFGRVDGPLLDTCGTGGDGAQTFNISTVAALVAAGAGCKVAKHGNRAVSSRAGSADLLTELGVNIACPAANMERALEQANFAFLFAPAYHAAMKHAMGPRRDIGIRTIFNMLGPLTNPAGATRQLLGVYDEKLCVMFAEALRTLGSERAMIVHGADGLDEITLTGPTTVAELRDGEIAVRQITPEEFGLAACKKSDLRGGAPKENARLALAILDGARGPARDVVLLNAAAAMTCAGLAPDLGAGLTAAAESIDSGRAMNALRRVVELSNA